MQSAISASSVLEFVELAERFVIALERIALALESTAVFDKARLFREEEERKRPA